MKPLVVVHKVHSCQAKVRHAIVSYDPLHVFCTALLNDAYAAQRPPSKRRASDSGGHLVPFAPLFHMYRSIVSYVSLECGAGTWCLYPGSSTPSWSAGRAPGAFRSIVSYVSLNCFICLAQLFHMYPSNAGRAPGAVAREAP